MNYEINLVFLSIRNSCDTLAKYACVCWLQCRLEGHYDADKHIVYLHLQSAYDSVVMADLCQIAEKDVSSNVCYSVVGDHSTLCLMAWCLMAFSYSEYFAGVVALW